MPRKDARARSPNPPPSPPPPRSRSPVITPKGYSPRSGDLPSAPNPYSTFSLGVISLFSLSSIVMMLANKCVVALVPQEGAWMLLMQVVLTSFAMATYAFVYTPSALNLQQLLAWAPCAILFTCNIVTSVMALEYITMPTFSVLRNVQPFISTALGLYLLPLLNPSAPSEPTNLFKLYALLLILTGTGIYAWKDIAFDLNGYLWVLGHITSMSMYVTLVKSKGCGSGAPPSSTMSL